MRLYPTLLCILILDVVTRTPANRVESKPSLPKWPYRLWPKGVVYYKFFPKNTFNASELKMVKTCMKTIEKNTCIRFVEKSCWKTGLISIYKNESRNDVCGEAHVGYHPKHNTYVLLVCMTPGVIYHEFMHTFGFVHKDIESKETDYCRKFSPQTAAKPLKATDGAEILHRQRAIKTIEEKWVKKINGLYCCKKKAENSDRDGPVSSKVGQELEPEVERFLGSVLSKGEKVQSDLKGLFGQLGSTVGNADQGGPLKELKKPLNDMLNNKADNSEVSLSSSGYLNNKVGHRQHLSFDQNGLEQKLMQLLQGNRGQLDGGGGHRTQMSNSLLDLLGGKGPSMHQDGYRTQLSNSLLDLLSGKGSSQHQDGHRKYVSQDEAIREVLTKYVNRITDSKHDYTHNAYAYNGSGGQEQRKCEKIIKILLEALREKTASAGSQGNLLESLTKFM